MEILKNIENEVRKEINLEIKKKNKMLLTTMDVLRRDNEEFKRVSNENKKLVSAIKTENEKLKREMEIVKNNAYKEFIKKHWMDMELGSKVYRIATRNQKIEPCKKCGNTTYWAKDVKVEIDGDVLTGKCKACDDRKTTFEYYIKTETFNYARFDISSDKIVGCWIGIGEAKCDNQEKLELFKTQIFKTMEEAEDKLKQYKTE